MNIRITFVDVRGQEHELSGVSGQSVMEVAIANGIDGIDAECGGACACATCHVYVDAAGLGVVGEAESFEAEMLEFSNAECRPSSRLSCQLMLRPELEGLRFTVAGS